MDFKCYLVDGKPDKFKAITKAPSSSSSTIPHVPITTVINPVQEKTVTVGRPKMKQPQEGAAKTTKKHKVCGAWTDEQALVLITLIRPHECLTETNISYT